MNDETQIWARPSPDEPFEWMPYFPLRELEIMDDEESDSEWEVMEEETPDAPMPE
jgi:hypothetical protein